MANGTVNERIKQKYNHLIRKGFNSLEALKLLEGQFTREQLRDYWFPYTAMTIQATDSTKDVQIRESECNCTVGMIVLTMISPLLKNDIGVVVNHSKHIFREYYSEEEWKYIEKSVIKILKDGKLDLHINNGELPCGRDNCRNGVTH